MKKGDIDENNYEKLKNISEKLIINDISPYEYTTKYFSETYKYLDKKNELNEERIKKLSQINKNVTDCIDKIEHELNKKNKKGKKDKIIPKTPDNKIEKFRNKYGLRKEDADDEKIKEQLKLHKNDEIRTYQALMNRIVNKK